MQKVNVNPFLKMGYVLPKTAIKDIPKPVNTGNEAIVEEDKAVHSATKKFLTRKEKQLTMKTFLVMQIKSP